MARRPDACPGERHLSPELRALATALAADVGLDAEQHARLEHRIGLAALDLPGAADRRPPVAEPDAVHEPALAPTRVPDRLARLAVQATRLRRRLAGADEPGARDVAARA